MTEAGTSFASEGTHHVAHIAVAGERLEPRGSGALWWPARAALVVGDLHLGRSERVARRGGALLPPYETEDTLTRLAAEIAALAPRRVICLGDSFDDGRAARRLPAADLARIAALAAACDWIWIAGNHDPDAHGLPGAAARELALGPLAFRHEARAEPPPEGCGEVSAHFHPKARIAHRGRRIARACFLADRRRVILPAFGTYTGGLDAADPLFCGLLAPDARAWLTGRRVTGLPRAGLLG